MLGILYILLSKPGLLLLLFISNRLIHRYKLTKLSFLLVLLAIDVAVYYLTLGHYHLAIYIYLVHLGSSLFLFNLFKNYNLIGVTGSIGSGKSTVMRKVKENFREMSIIDCDGITRRMFESDARFIGRVKRIFSGMDIAGEDGTLDRKKIASIIFDKRHSRLRYVYLFQVYARMVWVIFKELVRIFAMEKRVVAMIDAPLLFETRFLAYVCYPIITIYVEDEAELLKRVVARGKEELADQGVEVTPEKEEAIEMDIRNRLRYQMPVEKKIELSDAAIHNNGTVEELYQSFVVEMLKY